MVSLLWTLVLLFLQARVFLVGFGSSNPLLRTFEERGLKTGVFVCLFQLAQPSKGEASANSTMVLVLFLAS